MFHSQSPGVEYRLGVETHVQEAWGLSSKERGLCYLDEVTVQPMGSRKLLGNGPTDSLVIGSKPVTSAGGPMNAETLPHSHLRGRSLICRIAFLSPGLGTQE